MKCEIHKQIAEVCNDNITNEESVRKWFIMFNGGKSNVDNKECSGQLCVITEALKTKLDEDRCFTQYLDNVHISFHVISRGLLH